MQNNTSELNPVIEQIMFFSNSRLTYIHLPNTIDQESIKKILQNFNHIQKFTPAEIQQIFLLAVEGQNKYVVDFCLELSPRIMVDPITDGFAHDSTYKDNFTIFDHLIEEQDHELLEWLFKEYKKYAGLCVNHVSNLFKSELKYTHLMSAIVTHAWDCARVIANNCPESTLRAVNYEGKTAEDLFFEQSLYAQEYVQECYEDLYIMLTLETEKTQQERSENFASQAQVPAPSNEEVLAAIETLHRYFQSK